jgi:hypothetical protein
MAVIGKVTHNSKKSFLGGGMGVLIPFAGQPKAGTKEISEPGEPKTDSEIPEKLNDL